jgi:hypothetical protein
VAAPSLDSPCDGSVTYPGDTKILVKSSKGRSGPTILKRKKRTDNPQKQEADRHSSKARSGPTILKRKKRTDNPQKQEADRQSSKGRSGPTILKSKMRTDTQDSTQNLIIRFNPFPLLKA